LGSSSGHKQKETSGLRGERRKPFWRHVTLSLKTADEETENHAGSREIMFALAIKRRRSRINATCSFRQELRKPEEKEKGRLTTTIVE